MRELGFEHNDILFGADPMEGIVAAELAGRFMRLFIRDRRGVRFVDDPFQPFILLEAPALLQGFGREVSSHRLAGQGEFRALALFRDWHDCLAARDFLHRRSGKTPTAADAPYRFFSDPVHQHLLLTGKTLFKGMAFDALHRLALDIETFCAEGFEFSNPQRAEDRIISIAVMDSAGYEEVIFGTELEEGAMIERLGEIIRTRDPDVIEGHNIFRFDLEYIRVRADRLGIKLRWGRDGSEPRVHGSRFTVAERIVDYPRWDIFGRHVLDTYFLLLFHDVAARDLESFGLKYAARHFGLAAADRVYLDGADISAAYRGDPERLKRYNLDDVRETLALSRLLSYSHFLQTRIFPYSYQNCVIRGAATKINALFLREYLRREEALPRGRGADGEGELAGGYTDVFVTGVVGPVVHCDVASLYPSVMLAFGLAPASDSLGIFLPLLQELRQFRLRAKKLAKEAQDRGERDFYDALQQTFKVLINSFYGYLGTTLHNFSDQAAAAEITRRGRAIIREMLAWLERQGAKPVEVDTDGIYFIPPAGTALAEEEERLVAELSLTLPTGIEVELAGRYRAMLSYKMKNYALLGYDERIIIKGSALKSRGTEKYLRAFTAEVVALLLHGEGGRVEDVYGEYLEKLRDHRFPIEWLAKTETLGETPATYRQKISEKKRNPSAAFELARQSGREFRPGDQVSYYVTGAGKGVTAYENCRLASAYDPRRPDENVAYYAEKLRLLIRKFAALLPGEKTLFS
ncbi:MAG TPA: DNA polymerase domain-containing protein [Geobacteraceae bacterium]